MRTQAVRPEKMHPTQAERPSKKTTAAIGHISKSSNGTPKAQPGLRRTRGTTVDKTTSTNFPEEPVPKRFLDKLGEMYRAEKELTLALPLVVKAAKSRDLKALLKIHLAETKGHMKTLAAVAESLGVKLPSNSCKQMTQLIKEAVKVIGKRLISSDKDPELIAVGQRIEQFEIVSYTPLCAEAKDREYTHEFALLTSILNQEKLANELLGQLAGGKHPLGKVIQKTSLKKVKAAAESAQAWTR